MTETATIHINMVCPLCQMVIKDRPLEKWQPRTEIPSKRPNVKQFAHTKCLTRNL